MRVPLLFFLLSCAFLTSPVPSRATEPETTEPRGIDTGGKNPLDGSLAIPPLPAAEPLPIATLASLLPRAEPLADRFDWPETERFEGAWEKAPQQTWGLQRGTMVLAPVPPETLQEFAALSVPEAMRRLEGEHRPMRELVTRYRRQGADLDLEPVYTFNDDAYFFGGGRLQPLGKVWHSDNLVVAWLPSEDLPPTRARDAERATWAYARTLLGFEADPYPAPRTGEPGDPAGQAAWLQWQAATEPTQKREAAIALLRSNLPASDDRFEEVQRWARDRGDADLEMAVLQRYRPRGRCSRDLRPQILASRYSTLCFQSGRLGCTLQLQLRLMASAFDRMIWSSAGEAMFATDADHLWDLGIDARRFMMALALDFPDGDLSRRIGAYRLGRAVAESPEVDRLSAHLRAWVEDPGLDPANRLNAALVLLNVRRQYWGTYAEPAHELGSLDLPPLARIILEDLGSHPR